MNAVPMASKHHPLEAPTIQGMQLSFFTESNHPPPSRYFAAQKYRIFDILELARQGWLPIRWQRSPAQTVIGADIKSRTATSGGVSANDPNSGS